MRRRVALFAAVAVLVVTMYILEGLRISVWSGTQGLAEASIQVYLAGVLTVPAAAFVLWLVYIAGRSRSEGKE